MTSKWREFKKDLLKDRHVTEESLMLAGIKLQLAELFYDLRKKHKMSQKQLATAIKVSQPYIARIEDGEENMTIETITKLLVALNTCLKITPEGRHNKKGSILQFKLAA